MTLTCHPEFISGSTLPAIMNVIYVNQMLKRVQHDNTSHYSNIKVFYVRSSMLFFNSKYSCFKESKLDEELSPVILNSFQDIILFAMNVT
jgi:hypothetical protein